MHIVESQRIVRQLGRPVRGITGIGLAFVGVVIGGLLLPHRVGGPGLGLSGGRGTEGGVELPLALYPGLGIDLDVLGRWRGAGGGSGRPGALPARGGGGGEKVLLVLGRVHPCYHGRDKMEMGRA